MRASCSLIPVAYFVAHAIGFNRHSHNAVSMPPALDGFATIPIGAQRTKAMVPGDALRDRVSICRGAFGAK
jgi:hypothetical protein